MTSQLSELAGPHDTADEMGYLPHGCLGSGPLISSGMRIALGIRLSFGNSPTAGTAT
ncbi:MULTISPECIES: hypothetical protein [unclassified Rhodococcus (in: high G+C Gram-positive bacteria)]|uniref:hypothetical protein n=1 Tax=unclassified Rhodococcus (in: high G+C Gram-positive bacteria) TaxID=192944 RepID=UPI0015C68222|nr:MULTISPECIES: hypothetical protein [unclassified Rhodococcus (in: high G+C Gram-positive bacteria)]